ncbi:SPASM domain-containing protein [Candidatus Bipolaricaulota bacterium]|nr:SPASM domain-containing protein [Candidatus Bipolaricaulota bacterium]
MDCGYCFYREKSKLYPGKRTMTLERAGDLIEQALAGGGPVSFSWQGGEPTLAGLDFFREAIELQKKYGSPGQRITNVIQTNGTLLTEEWANFFSRYNFLVGLSLDGPKKYHNRYRTFKNGGGSFRAVMKSARLLDDPDVLVNGLAVLTEENVGEPRRLIDFFLANGLTHLQFLPAIELREYENGTSLAPFSPPPLKVGEFLDAVFHRWIQDFPPAFRVRYFDALLQIALGEVPDICRLRKNAASYLVVEHNGDVYPCDFFVEPEWKLGNVQEDGLKAVKESEKLTEFTEKKSDLPEACKHCKYLRYCRGGCPRYRNLPEGPGERSYLCYAYRYFLSRNLGKIRRLARKIKKSTRGRPLRRRGPSS